MNIAFVLFTFFVPGSPLIAKSKLSPYIRGTYETMFSLISPDTYQEWKKKLLGHTKGFGAVVPEKKLETKGNDGSR